MVHDIQVEGDRRPESSPDLVVIPCGAAKRPHPAPAGELYIGSYHRACRRAADRLGGRVLILSARHGLLPPDREIEPYDLAMGRPGSVTTDVLRRQAQDLGLAGARAVIVLAGSRYAEAAGAVWPQALRPLLGLGMGQQLRRLAAIAQHGATALAGGGPETDGAP